MGNQMLLTILAISLFTTLIMSMHYGQMVKNENMYKAHYYLQGMKVADKYFQKIESDLLGKVKTFAGTNTYYSSYTQTETVNSIVYTVTTSSTYCDSIGTTAYTSTDFIRVNVSVSSVPTPGDTLVIGTSTYPLSRIYPDPGL